MLWDKQHYFLKRFDFVCKIIYYGYVVFGVLYGLYNSFTKVVASTQFKNPIIISKIVKNDDIVL